MQLILTPPRHLPAVAHVAPASQRPHETAS